MLCGKLWTCCWETPLITLMNQRLLAWLICVRWQKWIRISLLPGSLTLITDMMSCHRNSKEEKLCSVCTTLGLSECIVGRCFFFARALEALAINNQCHKGPNAKQLGHSRWKPYVWPQLRYREPPTYFFFIQIFSQFKKTTKGQIEEPIDKTTDDNIPSLIALASCYMYYTIVPLSSILSCGEIDLMQFSVSCLYIQNISMKYQVVVRFSPGWLSSC